MRAAVVLVIVLLAPAALSGCVSPFGPSLPAKGLKTTCSTETLSLPTLPVHNENPPPAATAGSRVPGPTVKLGLIATGTTGYAASLGASLARSELRASGADLTVVERSINASASEAVAGVGALADGGVALVIDALPDNLAGATLNLSANRGVAQIATVTDAGWVTQSSSATNLFFRLRAPTSYDGRALAELVWASGCRTAKLVVAQDRDAAASAREFVDTFTARGGTVKGELSTSPTGPSDVAAFVASIGSADPNQATANPAPDAVVLLADPTAAAIILRSAYDARLTAISTFFLGSRLAGGSFTSAIGSDDAGRSLAAGLRGVLRAPVTSFASDSFVRAFTARYGTSPPAGAAEAYDAVYLAMIAAECAKTGAPRDVRLELASVETRDTGDTDVSGKNPAGALLSASTCAVNYVGAAHDYDWNGRGDVVTWRFAVWSVTESGSIATTTLVFEPRDA